MLELRPNCEWCDADLPPESAEARICSFECTFCCSAVRTAAANWSVARYDLPQRWCGIRLLCCGTSGSRNSGARNE